MKTVIDSNYKYTERNTELKCSHCGNTTDIKNAVIKDDRVYCCNGCYGISNIIYSLGLEEYYSLQNVEKHKSQNQPDIIEAKDDFSYLNQENFKKLYTTADSPNTVNFYIEGIHCTGCLWLIENLANTTDEIESVELNMSSNKATVKFKNDMSVFPGLVQSLGYKAHPLESGSDAKSVESDESKKLLYRIGVAGFCAGNIMLLSAAIYAGADNLFKNFFQIISAFLVLPVITFCSFPFYKNVINSIKYKKTNVDIAVVFIIIAGSLLSTINLFVGGETYFDSIAAFVFLLLLSRYVLRYVQNLLVRKSSDSAFIFKDSKISRWDESAGQYFLTPLSDVKIGEKVRLNKDDTIPFDGISLTRNSYIDVSVLTGENYPKNVCSGDKVYAGSKLESDVLTLRILHTGFETRIGKILKKIEDGSFVNKNLSAFTDRYSTIFTLTVAAFAIVFFLLFTYTLSFSESISRTISFVLVSCPCAFIFVLPLTYSYSIKAGFNKGFIIKELGFFDKVRRIKNIFFDKTGTLTNGRFRILKWDFDSLSNSVLSEIAAIQAKSEHPIAKAITRHISFKNLVLPGIENHGPIKKRGIYGCVNGNRYEFLNEPMQDINELNQFVLTRVNIFKNGEKISEILFGDTLREDAKLTIKNIKYLNIKPIVISGDRKDNVLKVASKIDVSETDTLFEQTPEDKINVLDTAGDSIMVGDGLNDSGALARADIGIAIQGSVEQSLKASDIFIIRKQLTTILDLIVHGKVTSGIVRNTVIVSLLYNITAGSFALLGYISPLAAAVLMPASSLLLLSISYLGHKKLRGISNC
ncbi:MAG: heavy metal translocating P-type ATPase [Thermodesulfobacteriota bacterium]